MKTCVLFELKLLLCLLVILILSRTQSLLIFFRTIHYKYIYKTHSQKTKGATTHKKMVLPLK